MLIIWGLRVFYHTIAQGTFFCRNCGGDRDYRHRAGRRFITIFFIPIVPLNKAGEHVQCMTCKTRYVTGVLDSPTAASAQAAVPAGVRAMVSVMLRTSGPDDAAARARAIEAVQGAGQPDFNDAMLAQDLSQSIDAARPMIAQLGVQLKPEARETLFAQAVGVAQADGPLSDNERGTAEMIAADLGLTKVQVRGLLPV